ncbi:MAG: DUF4426 domain-containing protein [Gammaproteobacteria bacterium]|nr:DUF4426 domain-containing protein [Gammaproteobacteria bacterium]MCK5262157.1 DUF4426 domain-containing protein [Gammaproteobacteria bacterium]
MYKKLHHFIKALTIFTLLGFGSSAYADAEHSKEFGDYVIHYNAFRSDTLSPEVAKNYNLTRRNNRVIINIAVLKKVLNTTGTPTAAKVTGHISNLTGQMRNIEFREIKEGTAIYYLSESQFTEGEFLKFELKVTPEGETQPARLKFDKKFSTH